MGQDGHIGSDAIKAWAFGSVVAYTISTVPWSPKLGFQLDAASGDSAGNQHSFGTFKPLFPNGAYFSLSGLIGYANLLHAKTSVTIHATERLKVSLSAAAQWRQTTADAIYTAPVIPVADTAGRGGRYAGAYSDLGLDWEITANTAFAVEALRYAAGEAIRQAGGHDTDYLSVEVRLAW